MLYFWLGKAWHDENSFFPVSEKFLQVQQVLLDNIFPCIYFRVFLFFLLFNSRRMEFGRLQLRKRVRVARLNLGNQTPQRPLQESCHEATYPQAAKPF